MPSPGSPAPHAPSDPDAELSPRYRLGRLLGTGGMAEVFLGTLVGAEGFTRTVAVKRVLPNLSATPRYTAMFVEEARLAARLAHPNIVPVFDLDRDAKGRLFLVMEYVDGMSLAELAGTGPVPYPVAAHVVFGMLSGLSYAHALPDGGGVIHRDVSPHNVLLARDGSIRISDFGVAKAFSGAAASGSSAPRGKTGYLSPEQLKGGDLDGRSDLFTAGIVFWELLAGGRLFAGSPGEAVARTLFHPVPPPGVLREGVPADLDQVAMRLLALDPCDRYRTAGLAIRELERCADARHDGRAELAKLIAERRPSVATAQASKLLEAMEPRKLSRAKPEGVSTLTEPPEVEAQRRAPWRDPFIARLEAELARKKRWRWAFVVAILCVIAAELLRVAWG